MSDLEQLAAELNNRLSEKLQSTVIANGELTLEISRDNLREICFVLRDDERFQFDMLIDVCGVDYLTYGMSEWVTNQATSSGFERGVNKNQQRVVVWDKPRFAVVYHLLSTVYNSRLRLRVFVDDETPKINSVTDIWPSANWFEREAFDLFGIQFEGHPDLRRILTDYGFIGHPFRKDFPLTGNVEVRYDAKEQRVIYQPVTVEPRALVPKVIRTERKTNTEAEVKSDV